MFAAAIHSPTRPPTRSTADRHRQRAHPHLLPDEVQAQLRALMKQLGLVYGAIDMRRTPEGGTSSLR